MTNKQVLKFLQENYPKSLITLQEELRSYATEDGEDITSSYKICITEDKKISSIVEEDSWEHVIIAILVDTKKFSLLEIEAGKFETWEGTQ